MILPNFPLDECRFKESTQWYEFFCVAKAIAKIWISFNIFNETLLNSFEDMHNFICIISCERFRLEMLSQAHSFPL